MRRGCLATLLSLCLSSVALAGPNAGGTIVVHDANFAYTADNTTSYCGLGSIPAFCAQVDTDLEGSGPAAIAIWKVYAAFWPNSSPRLKGISFGIQYPNGRTGIVIVHEGPCSCDPNTGGIELPGVGWPGSNTGTALVFSNTLTARLNEIYWFAGYTYSAGSGNIFQLRSHPDPGLGGNFADDSIPAVLDPIDRYGSLGFDAQGTLACPVAPGACCHTDGSCFLTWPEECLAPNTWNGTASCTPNPCSTALGACCDWYTGSCTLTTAVNCPYPSTWLGPNSVCSPNPCPPAAGACCNPLTGACTVTSQTECLSPNTWLGPKTTCDPNPCPVPVLGACCICGSCSITIQGSCAGQWLGAGVSCSPNPCGDRTGGHQYSPRTPHNKAAGTIGHGVGINQPRSRSNPCNGTLLLNYDGSAENGYCWQYGGVAPPEYGAFAECYNYTGSVCGMELDLTGIGNPSNTATLFIWSDNCGIPGAVISQVNVLPSGVPIWPAVASFDYAISANVSGNFWAGYWAEFGPQGCGYFIAADLNGPGGCPMTNIAPGFGYPTGWNSTSVVWGPAQALGIGAWVGGGPVPVTETTWGRIKSLYH